MNYLDIANSGFMFILCAIPVCVILVQTILFIRLAWKQGIEIGFDEEKMKQCVKTSATFSIIPSLTLVTLLVALSVSIGKFFPWLRLSNIGAGAYEAVAAGVGLSATGAAITLKSYDKTLRKAKKSNPFMVIGTAAAFTGIIARLTIPYYVNVTAVLPFIATITGAVVMFACNQIGKKHSLFKEFGLSFGIIAGVLMCIIVSAAGIVK